ncbi:MAG: hypothetical protein QOG49_97, partial [Frankiaceae bacterium]|nr:hypothetical protein [Frankiaceae bacterium]
VTAILVAHDGAAWLPEVLAALRGQIRSADLVIAVDTGSVDSTKRLLAAEIEARDIVSAGRTDGFGTAVAAGVGRIGNLGPLPLPVPYRPYPLGVEQLLAGDPKDADPPPVVYYDQEYAEVDYGEIDEQYEDPHDEIEVELPEPTDGADWLWLLHDDVAPEPDALLRLIEVAESSPSVRVLGPKVRDWDDPRLLVEVGLTIDHSGRRETGLERLEFDQGQHDETRDVLAVGSAGMLVRRDVWDELGGFDQRLPIFRDDIDFCWRANLAGHRVVVAPAARVRHARAGLTGRRRIRCAVGRAAALDRRHSLAVLLSNVSGPSLLWNVPRLLIGAVLRAAAFLLTRQGQAAADEIRAIGWNLAQVPALVAARGRRAPLRKVDPRTLRPLFAGRTARLRGYLEATGDWLSGGAAEPTGPPADPGTDDTGEDAAEIVGAASRGSRVLGVLRQPVVALTLLLLALTLVADRGLFGPGRLLGGHLLPAPASSRELWATYTASWHDVGGGSAVDAPAWMAVLAGFASLLAGKAWLAVDVLMLLAVPLSALSAYAASRRVTRSRARRLWGAAAYAVLPAATGAVAAGRLDVVVLAILLPAVASACLRAVAPDPATSGWRHAFVGGLALAVAAAFVPLIWVLAAVVMLAGIAAGAVLAALPRIGVVRRLAAATAVLGTSFAVLLPWSWRLAAFPRLLLAGLTPQSPAGPLRGMQALLLRPGGPAMPPAAYGALLLLAALPALLRSNRSRRLAGVGAWSVGMAAMALAVLGTRAGSASAWPGPALLVAGAAVITAAMIGATGGKVLLRRASFGWRQPTALAIALFALVAPLVVLGGWVRRGAGDPLDRRAVVPLPRYIVAQGETEPGLRVLWLQPGAAAADLRYSITPMRGGFTGVDQLPAPASLRRRLDVLVAALATPSGSNAVQALATHGVRYVAVPAPAAPAIAGVLDAQPALTRERADDAAGIQLWRVIAPTGRVMLLSGAVAREAHTERGPSLDALRADPPQVLTADPRTGRYAVPPGPAGRLLVVDEYAGGRWQVRTAGRPGQVRAWGWATAVEVPAEGTTATVEASPRSRRTGLGLQALALLVALVLAAPSVRRAEDELAAPPVGDDPPAAVGVPVGASV